MQRPTLGGLVRDLGLAAGTAALVTAIWATGAMRLLDLPAADIMLSFAHPPAPAEPGVAAVVIDDPSISRDGPLPWPRGRLAELVDASWRAGARAVVVDILLAEPGAAEGDEALAAALGRGPTLLAAALLPSRRWLLPLSGFGGAERAAHVHAELGPDGVVRTLAETKQAEGLSLPALAVAAARLLGSDRGLTPGALLAPTFVPPPIEIPTVSASDLLRGATPAGLLAGRVVFLGITAAGATDQFPVPTGGRRPAPGVLVHASAAASLAVGGVLHRAGMVAVAAGSLVLALAVQRFRSRAGRLVPAALLALAGAGLVVAATMLRFASLLAPPVTLVAVVGFAALLREGVESRQALRESDRLLAGLHAALTEPALVPRGAAGRLALVRELQETALRDRELRRVLLDGLDEGVVLWDASGEPVLANRAAAMLWDGLPSRDELVGSLGPGDADGEVERGGRWLELRALEVSGGRGVGLVRDVTAGRELARRRAEMQRLVSHELRTPLASLAGFGRMLERYQLSPEELRRIAGLVRSEAERLGQTVTAFLELERLGAGAVGGEEERVDLAGLVRARLEVLGPVAAERGQEVELKAEDGVFVTGVARLLERVVDNLLGNALKHPPEGAAVRVAVSRRGREGVLEVADDGPGIPAGAADRIFDRFFRGPSAGGSGSGLGLAVVREVVQWHGGEVSVASGGGRGATFTAVLPLAEGGGD